MTVAIDAIVFSLIDSPTPEQLADIRRRLKEIDDDDLLDDVIRVGDVWFGVPGWTDHWNNPQGVTWETLFRYWAPGYPSGHWPTIRLAIEAFRDVFGNAYYCGDNSHSAKEVDDDLLLEYTTAYTEPEED